MPAIFPRLDVRAGYVSVWHRAPGGAWTVYTSTSPDQSCPRFIGAAISRIVETPIALSWREGSDLTVDVPAAQLSWTLHLTATPVTRMMNGMMACMPAALFENNFVLRMMSLMSTAMLAAGRQQLGGHVANRQWFQAAPRRIWVVSSAHASLAGRDFGLPRALASQAMLDEVPMPQRGIVMMGRFSFETYAPGRHLSAFSGQTGWPAI